MGAIGGGACLVSLLRAAIRLATATDAKGENTSENQMLCHGRMTHGRVKLFLHTGP